MRELLPKKGQEEGERAMPQPEVADFESAFVEISAIMQMQSPTGRLDSESDALRGILAKLESGQLTPSDAILQARSLADNRQDGYGGGPEALRH